MLFMSSMKTGPMKQSLDIICPSDSRFCRLLMLWHYRMEGQLNRFAKPHEAQSQLAVLGNET